MKLPPPLLALLAPLVLTGPLHAFTVNVDLVPVSTNFDDFNDGIDTATNFNNMASAGESAGISSVTIPPGAEDPQFQYLSPVAILPFSTDVFPHLRVQSRSTAAGGAQIFPCLRRRPPCSTTETT